MPKPNRVYDPFTGAADHQRSKPGSFPIYERGEKSLIVDEPIERILGFTEHRIARIEGNIERISIQGVRIA